MTRAWVVAAAALAMVAGCGKSKKQCKAEADAIFASLTAANAEAPIVAIDASHALVTREDLPRTRSISGVTVLLKATGIELGGKTVRDGDALERELSSDKILSYHRKDGRLLFYIEPSVPWSRVVDAVNAGVRVGFDAPAFVFRYPAPALTPPPPSKIDAKLKAIMSAENAGNRATDLAELVTGVVKSCPALGRSFGHVGGSDPEDRATILIAATSEGLIDCNCDVDVDSVHAAMWTVLRNENPARVIAFDRTAPKQTLALPAETPWSEANKHFTPALENATLSVL